MGFGAAVRSLINTMKRAQSESIKKEQIPGQLDLFADCTDVQNL